MPLRFSYPLLIHFDISIRQVPCKNRQRQILATTTQWWGAESSLGLLLIWCPHNWHQHFIGNFEDNMNLSGLFIELFSIKNTVSWCIILYQYAAENTWLGCIFDMAHDHCHRRCLKKMSNLRTRPIYINAIVLIHFAVFALKNFEKWYMQAPLQVNSSKAPVTPFWFETKIPWGKIHSLWQNCIWNFLKMCNFENKNIKVSAALSIWYRGTLSCLFEAARLQIGRVF